MFLVLFIGNGSGGGGTGYTGCLGYSDSDLDSNWIFPGNAPPCSYVVHTGGKGKGGSSNSSGGSSGGSNGGVSTTQRGFACLVLFSHHNSQFLVVSLKSTRAEEVAQDHPVAVEVEVMEEGVAARMEA